MKLVYISPLRYPSEKAGSLFSMKSCEVFADEGIEVELWVPRRRNHLSKKDPFEYFGVKKNFKIRYFPVIDFVGYIPGAFYIMSYTFALAVFLRGVFLKFSREIDAYFFYSHEQFAILLLTFVTDKTAYEIHDFPSNKILYRTLFKRLQAIVVTNTWKSEELIKCFNLSKNKIVTVPNAVDMKDFNSNFSKEESRNKLHLSVDDYLVGYVGALRTMGMEKGIDVLIDSLAFLNGNYKLYIVGGKTEDICYYVAYADRKGVKDRVIFAQNVPHKDIELYTSACDVLVAPYPDTEHYRHYMSPMKIFEYMASGRPMIVTDLPSVREIVDETMSLFVPPDNPQAIAKAILQLADDKELSIRLAERARVKAKADFTWENRARKILNALHRKYDYV